MCCLQCPVLPLWAGADSRVVCLAQVAVNLITASCWILSVQRRTQIVVEGADGMSAVEGNVKARHDPRLFV